MMILTYSIRLQCHGPGFNSRSWRQSAVYSSSRSSGQIKGHSIECRFQERYMKCIFFYRHFFFNLAIRIYKSSWNDYLSSSSLSFKLSLRRIVLYHCRRVERRWKIKINIFLFSSETPTPIIFQLKSTKIHSQ